MEKLLSLALNHMSGLKFVNASEIGNWDELVLTLPNYSFLDSEARYKHLEKINVKTFRYAIYDMDEFVGIVCGNISRSKIFGKHLECKHSPILKKDTKEYWESVVDFCKSLALENGCFMLRMSPLYEENQVLGEVYEKIGALKSPTQNIDALISQYFDMTKPDDELRHDMTDSTRNNINKLMKNQDISVRVFDDNSQFGIFSDFHEQTKRIKGYVDKPTNVLLDELQTQIDRKMCYMIVGYFKDKPISIWQCTVYGKYMHIYQAGSDTEFREKNIRVTYLLFWESVKLAKQLGCQILDLFGGMTPNGYRGTRHPWKGVSAFKEGLGGRKVTYMHSRDIPLNKLKYLLFYIISYVRVTLKGYTVKW